MRKAGITRIAINEKPTGPGSQRFRDAEKLWETAAALYRDVFASKGMPLREGYEKLSTPFAAFEAGYDHALGIDVFLLFDSGMESTIQEKFLFTRYNTVTVEYMQDWRKEIQGDWFNLRAQYYFTGYRYDPKVIAFDRWILLDWPACQRATAAEEILWQERCNQNDGARASFKYFPMTDFPPSCVIAEGSDYHLPVVDASPQQPSPAPCARCSRPTEYNRPLCPACYVWRAWGPKWPKKEEERL